MKFTKMNGLGNDYIYINVIENKINDPNTLAKRLSDRHFGIGGDGIVLIGKSEIADFSMRMFNADGSESEMCGNAIRCVGSYVYENGLTNKTDIKVETLAGIKEVSLILYKDEISTVSVNMGYPKFLDEKIMKITIEDKVFCGYKVSVGNPHFVIFVEEFAENIMYFGEKISNKTDVFTNRTNVEFAKVIDRNYITMRVYERGASETLSCGTGATAVFFVANALKKASNKATISLLGGMVICEKEKKGYYLTGKVETNFVGEFK